MPKISVIVPIYNSEKFLNKCIDGIINQTFKDLEIILVDDGSTDNSGNICDAYAQKDKRIKVIHKGNGGVSSARNSGLDIAEGTYVSFIDSDDYIDKEMYEELYGLIQKENADIACGGYRFYRPWKVEDKTISGNNSGEIKVYSNDQALREFYFGPQLNAPLSVITCNKIYKLDLVKKIRFKEKFFHEDVLFTPKALYFAKKIAAIDKDYYTYNIHLSGTQISKTVSVNKILSEVIVTKEVSDFFSDNYVEGITEHTKKLYCGRLINAYYELYIRRKNIEYREKLIEIRQQIKAEKKMIISNTGISGRLCVRVPFIYCLLKSTVRRSKKLAYNLKRIITGKN